MLTIRREQFTAFEEAGRLDFERRALRFLAGEHPDFFAALGDGEEAGRFLRRVTRRAEVFGVATESGVVLFAQLSIIHGENFYQREVWASDVLRHEGLDAAAKVERLREYVARGGEG